MIFERVNYKNYDIAIRVQNEIFPGEDATLAILASIDRALFNKNSKLFKSISNIRYYLVKVDNNYIGITGLYSLKKYRQDAWLG